MQLGEVYFDIAVNELSIDSSIKKIRTKFENINSLNLSVLVDDSALTRLNKHFDLKKRHYEDLQKYFKSNPLKIDVASLQDDISAQLKKIALSIDTHVSYTVDIQSSKQTNSLESAISKSTYSINRELQNIQGRLDKQTEKISKLKEEKSIVSKIVSPVTNLGKSALSSVAGFTRDSIQLTVGNISKGSFTRIGEEISKNIGVGISASIEELIAPLFGSTKEVSKQVSKGLFSSIKDEIPKVELQLEQYFEKIYQQSKNTTNKVKKNIIETLRTSIYEGVTEKLISNAATGLNAVDVTLERLSTEAKKQQELYKNLTIASPLAVKQQGATEVNKAQLLKKESSLKKELRFAGRNEESLQEDFTRLYPATLTKDASAKKAQEKLIRIQKTLHSLESRKTVINRELDKIALDLEKIDSNTFVLEQISKPATNKKLKEIQAKKELSKPKLPGLETGIYDRLARLVAKDSTGVDITPTQIPKIKLADKLNNGEVGTTQAEYDHKTNTMVVPQELYEAIKRNELTTQQIYTLTHEFRHGVQFGFGQIPSGEAVNLIKPTPEQALELAPRIDASTRTQTSTKARARALRLEADAYTYEQNKGQQFGNIVKKDFLTDKFHTTFGLAGSSKKNDIAVQVIKSLNEIKSVTESLSIDASKEVEGYIETTNKIQTLLNPLLEEASKIEFLPVDELETFYNKFEIKAKTFSVFLDRAKSELLTNLLSLDTDNVKTNLSTSLKRTDIYKLSKELNVEVSSTDKKHELIEKLTQPNVIAKTKEVLGYRNFQNKEITREAQVRQGLPASDLSKLFKTNIANLKQTANSAVSGSALIELSSKIEKEYQIILTLLSSDLSEDSLKVLQNAKLNLSKLRKKIIVRELNQVNKTPVVQTQTQDELGNLASFADIGRELETLKIQVSEFVKQQANVLSANRKNILNKNLITKSTQSVNSANESLNNVSEAKLNNQVATVNEATKILEVEANKSFENFAKFFESRLESFTKVIASLDERIFAQTPETLPDIPNLLSINKPKNPLSIFNKGIENPNSIPRKLSSAILNARKESAVNTAGTISLHSAGLSGDLLTSSNTHSTLGNKDQAKQLLQLKYKLDNLVSSITKEIAKPVVSFTAEDTERLENLNSQALKIFNTFNRDIPQNKGFLSLFNNNILANSIKLFENLGSVVKDAFVAFLTFNIGQAILPQLQQFLTTSVKVSAELENIKRILDTSSDNTGLSRDVASNAKTLKISIRDSLEAATEFTSAVEGTTISGEIGQKVFSNFQKYFAARGGSKDQQQRANLQLEQIAALGQITYPDLKPLAQAVPGISGVLARSQGITPGELRNRLTTDGGLGNDALVQFSQQAAIEAQTGLSAALDTTNAATINLENSFLGLQVRVGDLLQPSYKAILNTLAGGLSFISDKVDLLGLGLANIVYLIAKPFAIVGYKFLGVVFGGLITQIRTISADLILQGRILALNSSGFRAFGSIATQGFASLASGIKGVAVALAPMVLEFAAVSAVIVIIDQVIKSFQDLSGAIGKLADNNVKNLTAFKESLKGVKPELGGGLTDDKFLRGRRNWQRDYNPLNTSYKESQDTTKAIGTILNTSQETLGVINNSDLDSSIKKVLKLDRALIDVQNKRKATLQINPNDLEQLQRLNKEQINITNERYKTVEPVTGAQAQLSERIEVLKNARKALEALKNEDNIDKTTYLNQSKGITEVLQPLESLQNKITKAVGETISAYGYLKRSIELVNAELEDTKIKQEKVYLGQKQGIAERLDISQATRNLSTSKIDTDNLIKQKQNIEINASQLQAQLQQPSAKSVLDAYKITDDTEEGTLKYLADKAPDSSKFILEQQSKLVSVKKEVAQLNLQIAEARLTAYNQQVDLTKSIADYYVGIANQAEISALDTKKLISANKTNEGQNKLRKALEDGHDNIITQYVDSIIESLGQKNNVADKALEAQKQLIQIKQTGYDQQKAYGEITRSIPDSINTQPAIVKPRQLVDVSKISTEISKPVIINTIATNLKKEAVEVEKSLNKIDLNKAITNEVIPGFKKIGTQFYQSIKTSSDDVVAYLRGLDFSFLSQSFTGLGYIFTDLTRITTDWFNQLISVDELSKFFTREFTEIGQIFNNIVAVTSDWFNRLIPIDEINKILHQSFTGIGLALQGIGKDTYNWVNSVIPLNDILTAVNQSFLGLGLIIDDVVKKTQVWFGYIQQALGGLQQGFDSLSQGTQNLAQDTSTGLTKAANDFGSGIQNAWNQATNWITGGSKIKPTGIVESVGGSIQKVKTYADIEKHHPSAGVEAGRSYDKLDGKLEEIRNRNGTRFVKKDFILDGGRGASVPSPVGGVIKQTGDEWNTTHILDPQTKQILATFLHMSNIIKSGTVVKPGDRIGSQSDVGSPGSVHVHAEMVRKQFEAYIPAIVSGNFTKMPSNNVATPGRLGNANMVDSRQQTTTIASTIPPGLTPQGNKYASYLNDPRVRSFLRAIAIAEVGETLVNAGKGYGKQIGGNYSKEEFSNPERLTRIPASLPGRGGQNAFGRYQFHQADLVEGNKIGVRNLSPQSQDIIAVQKLAYRGALEPLLRNDIPTAIKKAGNEWASLAGSKYAGDGLNATTAGGKLPAFMRNYQQGLNNNAPGSVATPINGSPTANNVVKSTLQYRPIQASSTANSVVKSALQYRPVSNTNLRQTIDEARQIQLNTTSQQQQAQFVQSQQDLAKEKDDYIRKQNAALRTFQRAGEQLDDSYITRQRNQSDLGFQNLKNPSPKQSQNNEITTIIRRYDDLLRDNNRAKRDATERVSDAQKALATGQIPEGQSTTSLKERLAKDNTEIESLKKSIPELEKLRSQAISESEKLFKRDESLRLQNTNFELRTQELTKTRSDLEALKIQSSLTPYHNIALEIPALERKLSLQESDLELEKAIADIEEKRYKNTYSADSLTNDKLANEQIELIKKQNISKQEGIDLTFQQADANAKLEYNTKIIERENTLLGIRNDMRQEELKFLELTQKRNPLIGAGEQFYIQKETDDESRKGELARKQFDITNDIKLTPAQRQEDIAKINELYSAKERNANEQFAIDLEQQKITNLQTLASRNTSQRDFLSKPTNDLISARANQITSLGGNQFEANALQRPNARLQENNRYVAEIDSFNSQAAELKFQGLITDDQIDKMREALAAIHDINLENVNDQFKTFGRTIDDIAKSSIKGLSSGLADVILKGGSLTDVFMNFADTLLSGVLQAGLDSLLSSLTGSLFGSKKGGGGLGGLLGGGGGGGILDFVGSIFGGGGGLGGILGFASGGEVPFVSGMGLRDTETALGRALKREGHDAVLSTLTPGERVLTKDENRLYNALHPDGIMNITARNFNKGGELIPSISESVVNNMSSRGSTNVAVNASIESQGKGADERQLAKSIRAVVIAELKRQERIKNS